MNSVQTSLILLLFLQSAISQKKQHCSVGSWQGECIKFDECPFTRFFGDILNSDDIIEIRKRASACSSFGKKLLCCEPSTNYDKRPSPAPVTRPAVVVTKPTVQPNVVTLPEIRPQGDPLLHRNYNLFKDLKCGSSYSNRVANGEDANIFEFPWAARLGYESLGEVAYSCGGSVISEFYVLTAAHCLVFLPKGSTVSTVRLGEYDTSKVEDCDDEDPDDPDCSEPVQDIKAKSFVAHPNFNRLQLMHDIGLVQLSKSADFKRRNIKPICLPFPEALREVPNKLIVIGWGGTENAYSSAILQKASLPFYDLDKCEAKLLAKNRKGVTLGDGQFCAGGEGKVDACKGDSGSAVQAFLPWTDDKPRMVQYGIVSYGVAKCGVEVGFPGVYSKVPNYLEWILDNMK